MENTRVTLSGKMFPVHSAAITEETSSQSFKRSRNLPTPKCMFLNLREKERQTDLTGSLLEASWVMDGLSLGELSTLNTGESPSVAVESTLFSILEVNAPEKYYLSAKACQGILNRAKRRGKQLPAMLEEALIEVVNLAVGDTP